ncbi:protein AUXIN-REGULATED GENE INVOLVED IN ORGAN SIZE-like [Cryptomeria japonica]|uniref:protein AUXIN-REGULATED GENE INVOLVED IN ORGAN SIZE-like n=1 Tax=Cryptomeria japonica TaxID=3369 RepID=UPI0025AB7E40|nr:protein AUXIN-REGULATED GENE INVOLVED IN ORGAN SIZE-like [Cryptomeria japonica]
MQRDSNNIVNVSRNASFVKVPYRRGEAAQMQKSCSVSCYSVESVLVLFWLTVSLLVLPLILPTLPPPPFILLLVPIVIFVMLMVLAFMPGNVTNTVVSSV